MIIVPLWQMFLAMVAAQVAWDVLKMVWVSYRTVMNRDYDGRWWPTQDQINNI